MARKKDVVKKIDQKTKSTGAPLPLIQEDQPAPPAFYLIPAPDTLVLVGQAIFRSTQAPLVSVALSWQEAPNIAPDYYNVEWDESSSFTNVQRKRASTTSATIDGLKANGVTYYFRVQAVLGGIYSPFSETLSVVTMNDTTAPPIVTGLSATFINGDLYISWTKPVSEIFKDVEIRIYNGAHSVLYETLYSSGQSIVWTAEQNFAATGGTGTTSVSIDVLSRSWFNTYSTIVNTTATSSAPSTPTVTSNWDSDTGFADEDLVITWPAVTNTDSYDVVIDGTTYNTKDLRFVYRYETNVGQHVPTLASGDMNLTLAVYARNKLNQLSTPASSTKINVAPPTAYIQLGYTTGFSQIAANATVASGAIIQDFDHWEWILTDGVSTIQSFNSTTNDVIFALNTSATYNIGVKAVDKFNQKSSYVTANGIVMDVLTIDKLRAEALYTDDVGNSSSTLANLKDGSTATTVTYAGTGAGVWHWTKIERPLVDRYGVISVVINTGTPDIYVGLSLDDVTYDWYSGPLTGTYSSKLTSVASQAAAQSAAVNIASIVSSRVDIPTIKEARYVKIYHRSNSSYAFSTLYPRRIIQTDDLEAETISAINLAAGSVTANKISVINLQAVSAQMGNLHMDGVIDIASAGGIYQGSGSFASPTTGLKIFNSSGVGKLSTYNGGTEQITLDTDGKFKAGAGNVVMDATGIRLAARTVNIYDNTPTVQNIVGWTSGGNTIATIEGFIDASDSTTRRMSLLVENAAATARARITMSPGGITIKSDVSSTSSLIDMFGNSNGILYRSAGDHTFYDGSNNVRMIVKNAGNVGIGTSSPTAKLDVTDGYIRARDGTNTAPTSGKGVEIVGTGSVGYVQSYNRDSSAWQNLNISGQNITFSAGGSELLSFTSAGKITSPTGAFSFTGTGSGASSSIELGDTATGNRFAFMDFHGDDTYTDYGLRIIRNNNGANANSELQHRGTGELRMSVIDAGSFQVYTNSAQALAIGSAGNMGLVQKLYIGGTGTVPSYQIHLSTDSAGKPNGGSWTNSTSDARTKTVLGQYEYGLDAINALNLIRYEYNGLGGSVKGLRGIGFIAQEAQKVIPEMVNVRRAKLYETDDEETDILTLNNDPAIYASMRAIQELSSMVKNLQSEVAALKNK